MLWFNHNSIHEWGISAKMLKFQYQNIADFSHFEINLNWSSLKDFYRTLSNREWPELTDDHAHGYYNVIKSMDVGELWSKPRPLRISRPSQNQDRLTYKGKFKKEWLYFYFLHHLWMKIFHLEAFFMIFQTNWANFFFLNCFSMKF